MIPFMFLQSGAAILFIVFFVLNFMNVYTDVVIPGKKPWKSMNINDVLQWISLIEEQMLMLMSM